MKVEAVFCESKRSWVLSDWFVCPQPYCCDRVSLKCARKNWPRVIHRLIVPDCFGEIGTQPDLLCDTCPTFHECVAEAMKT